MCSDLELFLNLVYMTSIMTNLQNSNFEEYLKCIELTQDWEKFRNIQDIVELNNVYLNNAIKELIQKEEFINKIKENTEIEIEKIQL